MTIKTAADLRNRPAGQSPAQQYAAVAEARQQHFDAMSTLINAAEIDGRDLLASERRDYDAHETEIDRLDVLARTVAADHPEVTAVDRSLLSGLYGAGGSGSYRPGEPLAGDQSMAGYVQARGLAEEGVKPGERSFAAALRGIATGNWRGAEGVRNAMGGGTGSAGGYAIPTILSGEIIDLARKQAAVLKAGARVVPMESRTVDIAKWTGDPTPAWHTEAGLISPTDATLSKVTLSAHTLASLTVVSRELLEDAEEIDTELRKAFAADFALTVDLAALYGSGTPPEPTGVKNAAGVTKTALGTNGATPASWDWLVDSVGRLRDVNENPNAVIYSPRTARTMAKLKDTTGQPIELPDYIGELDKYDTNQVGNAYTVGSSSLTSDAFVADWSQLYLGVRTDLSIQVLTERFADYGQVGFLCWWRGDIQVARAAAFDVTTGILA